MYDSVIQFGGNSLGVLVVVILRMSGNKPWVNPGMVEASTDISV